MNASPSLVRVVFLAFATVAVSPLSRAQVACPLAWQPGDPIPGLDGPAYAMSKWDPDGTGPLPEMVVVGGEFRVAGDQAVDNIALYDPVVQRWLSLGGVSWRVNTILVRSGAPARPLVVGTSAGVQEWNGSGWQALGPAFNNEVGHLLELPNGDLIAGGRFGSIGPSPIAALARWDGGQWQAMGNPSVSTGIPQILGLALLPNGDLVVGGVFAAIGGIACNNVARWDGTTWHPLGAGSSTPVSGLVATAAGEVLAMGDFGVGSANAARWNGASWVPLPPGVPALAHPFAVLGSNGVLFRATSGIWLQDAAAWTQLAPWTPLGSVNCAALLANGEVLAGGNFLVVDGTTAWRVAHRRNGVFGATNSGSFGTLQTVVPSGDGGYLVGGSFQLGGMPNANFAHFDGVTWTRLAAPGGTVLQILVHDDGSALLSGLFLPSGSSSLVHWTQGSATFVPLPAGMSIAALAPGTGATYVGTSIGGTIGVARWDGGFLVPTPLAVSGSLSDLVELPNGDLLLAGLFHPPLQSSLLRWDGQQLQAVPGAPGGIKKLALAANGDLLVGGQLTAPFQAVARWDGSTWHALGALASNGVLSLDTLPNGDLVLSQRPLFLSQFTVVQRWDGVQWTQLGVARGTSQVVWSPVGELVAFGDFFRVDNTIAAAFTRLQSACPATAQDLGGGCSGSSGPLTTRVDERAWLGGTFQATTRGVATNALALGVFGASTTSLPLPQLLAIGGAGCTLRATPDVVGFAPVWNGRAEFELSLPSAPSLLGASFVQQTLVLETAAGSASALLAGPGTQLTVGAW